MTEQELGSYLRREGVTKEDLSSWRTICEGAIDARFKTATFAKFKQNPEQFITETAWLITEQKATVIVEHLSYDPLDGRYDSSIFTENQTAQTSTGSFAVTWTRSSLRLRTRSISPVAPNLTPK